MIPVYEKKMPCFFEVKTRCCQSKTVPTNRHNQRFRFHFSVFRLPSVCHSERSEVLFGIERFSLDESWLDFHSTQADQNATSFPSWPFPIFTLPVPAFSLLKDGTGFGDVGVKRFDHVAVFFFDDAALDL